MKLKWILLAAAAYLYWDMKKKLDGALADRTALIGILTPEQQAALIAAVQATSNVATAAAQGAVTAGVAAATGK